MKKLLSLQEKQALIDDLALTVEEVEKGEPENIYGESLGKYGFLTKKYLEEVHYARYMAEN